MARQGEDMTRRIALSDSLADGRGRFLVGGQATQAASGEIKMYEWRKEVGQMGMIGLQTDVGQIRAMAWSPMPTHRNLVATGLSSGRTVLLNVSPATLALPANNTAPSSSQFTVAQLSVKHIRAVTAVAFSPVDSNYLATGYDRHRSDYSLLIWDVADAISRLQPENNSSWRRPLGRLDINNPQAKDPRWLPTEPRPIQQYCPNETINSLCFLHSDIDSLLVGANGKSIRLYDLRAPNPPPAGTSPRDNSVIPGVSAQWATRAVNGLAADPNRGERFASFELNSGECVVKVFDVRKPGMETLSFKVTGTVVALEWLQDGRLAAGTKEHGVTLWNFVTGSHETKDGKEDFTEVGGMRMLSTPKKDLHSFAFPSTPSGQKDILVVKKDGSLSIGPIGESPTLASASRGDMVISTSTKLHVVSPDDAPPRSRASSTSSHGDTHKNDDEDDKASISFEDYKRQNRFQMAPEGVNRILAEAGASRGGRQKSGLSSGYQTPRSTEKGARFGEMRDYVDEKEEIMGGFDGLGRILRGDMGYAMRCKAEEGYGLADLHLNAAISTRFTGRDRLAGVWELLDHLITVMPPSTSTYREYDLSHYGLYPLWLSLNLTRSNEDSNTTPPRPTATSSSHLTPPVGPELPASSNSTGSRRETVKQGSSAWSNVARSTNVPSPVQKSGNSPQNLPSAEQENGFQEAVLAINEKRTDNGQLGSIGSGKLPPTDKEAQRRMMVVICGEGRDKAVISEVNRLIEDGQRTKAACWAYFSGDEEPAISILMNSDNEKHRLMASTIAGFLTQSRALRGSEFWNSHWPSLINKVDDPYIRAILLKIGGDNWESVLEEEAIPLLDRVAIAMFHLSDKALTNFLKDRYQRCLRHASLHGLLLTGLTSLAIPLLQAFLDRTSDIQTVSLLSAFIPSSQLDAKEKKQVERWVEGYRDLLDSWGMFTARSNFDVHRWERLRKLGEEMGDERIICPACNNQVGKVEEGHINRNAVLRSTTTWPNERTTTCSLCTSVLPRCIICLLHVQPRFADPWEEEPSLADTLDAAYVCCLSCRHGGHANHILPWFNGGLDGEPGHDQCAVAGCQCECANI